MSLKRRLLQSPLARWVLLPHRARLLVSYHGRTLVNAVTWLARSREHTNFSYELDPLNQQYLAAFIGHVTGAPRERIERHFAELLNDAELRDHIGRTTAVSRHRWVADARPKYGRRLGWYALVRELKPRVVVETGVDKGLGSCVIAAALRRNAAEGSPGRSYGTDINPEAGYLLGGPYAQFAAVLYGDSIATLEAFAGTIDLLINDSDHSSEYEGREYAAVRDKLSPHAVVLGDNAHVTSRLLEFAEATGRTFLYWQEKPRDHWYSGAGIGVAVVRTGGATGRG
jgi:predicted O-methyltransferase YrrM